MNAYRLYEIFINRSQFAYKYSARLHFHVLKHFMIFLIFTNLIFLEVIAAPTNESNSNFELIILHNNDIHGRFEETGVKTSKCLPEEKSKDRCYGGFSRTLYVINKYRKEASQSGGIPVLYLNAGDTYTGTPWFTVFKHNITAAFMNLLKPEAISLGNHEFDEGVKGLVPFLNEVNFPVLAANLDLRKAPELANNTALRKSIVLNVGTTKVGVIGYLTPETKFLAFPNDVEYYPEIESINLEAKSLRSQGINIIIALGHSGFKKDQEIAKNCPDIDVVIGGHTNTFLYNGVAPDTEEPEGPYPTIVEQPNGKKVPVVQAFAYTKYLGHLKVKFDANGNLISWNGQPILLDSKVPQEQSALDLLELYRPSINELERYVIGYTRVDLEGRSKICRTRECNLGNLITDSMVYLRAKSDHMSGHGWTDAAVAFIQGGGIRSSISKSNDGEIRQTELVSVLPFDNKLFIIEVTGSIIRRALERSASLFGTDSNGGFLQMSGIQVVYDISKPINERVVHAHIRCAKCDVPEFSELQDDKKYKIILNAFILAGGDGHKWTNSTDPISEAIPIQYTEQEAVIQYVRDKSPIYPGTEWRITVINSNNSSDSNNCDNVLNRTVSSSQSSIYSLPVLFSILLMNMLVS